jgi:hypothetical protein
MARTLSVTRVVVADSAEPEYLRTVAALARLSESRGRYLWLFRARQRPGLFLECSESRTEAEHRAVAPPADDEARLEARLRELASYQADPWELWEEVRF